MFPEDGVMGNIFGGFLSSDEIKKRILEKGMIVGYKNIDKQLQPNGFDMTAESVEKIEGCGTIGINFKELPERKPVEFQCGEKYWLLHEGEYAVWFNETVKLPLGVSAITISRSSVARCGCLQAVGSWDTGYNGRGFSLLTVGENPLRLYKDAHFIQMHFIPVIGGCFGYNGSYQKENL